MVVNSLEEVHEIMNHETRLFECVTFFEVFRAYVQVLHMTSEQLIHKVFILLEDLSVLLFDFILLVRFEN